MNDREKINIDIAFKKLLQNDCLTIYNKLMAKIIKIKKNNKEYYKIIKKYYEEEVLWGNIDLENNIVTLIEKRALSIFKNKSKYKWLYNNLVDDESKRTLYYIINYWFEFKADYLIKIKDKLNDQYFVKDIIKCDKNEVFVDVGCYVGDTVISYLKNYGNNSYKKIYCFDIVPKNIEKINEVVEKLDLNNIFINNKGIGDKEEIRYINNNNISPITKLENEGKIKIDVILLDNLINDKVTFIKMDIEGDEEKALLGCSRIIKEHHPKLAICVYHNYDQLYKVPEIINNIDPTYKFYLRYHGDVVFPGEYVLYAI